MSPAARRTGSPDAAALLTVTLAAPVVAVFPATSVALAAIVTLPFGTVIESHSSAYGAPKEVRTTVPFTRKSTRDTPVLSDAFADRVRTPVTVPPVGAVSETVGGVVSLDGGGPFQASVTPPV